MGRSSFIGSLDAYTTNLDSAWSVSRRLLASYTGPLVRVRRSSDNTEQDIGFVPATGQLDTTALLAFTGGGNGFVRRIYAQTGGSTKDFLQATASVQPRIVNAGNVCTVGTNNRPCCEVVTDNIQFMATTTFTALTGSSLTVASFFRLITTATNSRLIGGSQGVLADTGLGGWVPAYVTAPGLGSFDAGNRASLTLSLPKNQAHAATNTSGSHILRTSSTSNTSSFTTSAKNIDRWLMWCFSSTVSQCHAGSKFGESAIWTANRDADMTTHVTSLETYYGV
jgi:hypothetical protein